MNQNRRNKIFISLFIIFWIVTLFSYIQNKNLINEVQNRNSIQFSKWSLRRYINNEFQNNIEEAGKDQMPYYKYFQLLYPKLKTYINYETVSILKMNQKSKYIDLGGIYLYKNYFLYEPITKEEMEQVYQKDIKEINKIAENISAKTYLYYINNDETYSFDTNQKLDVDTYIKEKLSEKISFEKLEINSFKEYKKYYYQSDHHINHQGADQIYREIADQMNLENKLEKKEKHCWKDKKVQGSKTRIIGVNNLWPENICVYTYDIPSYTVIINQEEVDDYGSSIEEIEKSKEISYGTIYGWDHGEIIFQNKENQNGKKLLIFSNSYSNAINRLLASSYEETYVIDVRHNEDFNFVEYVQEKQIDDVLILANKMLFYDISWGDF